MYFVLLIPQEVGKEIKIHFRKSNLNLLNSIFRPDSSASTITLEEKDRFNEIKERLRIFLENQVTNFR
jgi:hypothetical protein